MTDQPFRVAEFWSSANPKEKVLCLAQDQELEQYPQRTDFIRWVDDPDALRFQKLVQLCTSAKLKFGSGNKISQVTLVCKNSVETSVGYRDELRKLVDELEPTYESQP